MPWTKEQECAINATGASLLVSAAAGSGKTSVLVERLIRQLSDTKNKIPADKMIIVTFTKDAASEMKQRLTTALSQLIEKNPENSWLSRQQLLLQSAKISTIHSFCFDLIRDNIQELELSPGFRIMDETEAGLMLNRAISDLVTKYYEKFPEKIEKLYDRFCYKDDSAIERLVADIYNFISSIPFGEKWLGECCERYKNHGDFYNKLCNSSEKTIISMISEAESYSAECSELITESENDKAIDIIDKEYFSIKKIRDDFGASGVSLKEKAEAYNVPEFARLVLGKKVDEDLKEQIKALRDSYKEILKETIPEELDLLKYADEDFDVHYELLTILGEMISELENQLWKTKVEKNAIGFSDAETLAVKLLSVYDDDGHIKKSPLACELSEYYKIIMIDEFQDTNNNQDLIFKLLSHNGTAEKSGDNMFMVGDVKQSIYRFRLANPKNFINTMNSSVKYNEEEKSKNSYIQLNKNFRSSEDVIGFVNFIFRGIMSEKAGDICYDEGEELVLGASFLERNRKTEVAVITGESENVSQAIYTAKKISSMLKEKVQVDNKDGKSSRDCTRRDFCILLRRKSDAAVYVNELSKLGIPAYSEETSGYLKSREISVILNILRIIDNPLIDTAFVAIMLSPMFMITDDELAMLRANYKKGHIYDALLRAIENAGEDGLPPEFIEKLKYIRDTLTKLRMYSATMSLMELIKKIYDRTDFISVIRMYDDGEKKRANLRALLEYARTYQESSDDGLSGFLRYIDRIVKINGDFSQGQTVSTSEDVVMIKTIHKSKGLEFPFVFLCETQVAFNTLDQRKNIQLNFDYGIGFRLQNRREFQKYVTLPFRAISKINTHDSVSEEMRLLYVALTRAKERLFIPLLVDIPEQKKLYRFAKEIHKSQGITPQLSMSANSMNDWLLMSLITHHNSRRLRELSGYDMFFTEKSDFDIEFIEVSDDKKTEKNEENVDLQKEAEVMADKKVVSMICDNFDFKYDMRLSTMPAKVSVSDISKNDDRFDLILKRPSFVQNRGKMTPTERGTVVHSILQHADFAELKKDILKEVDRVVQHGFITENQKKQIDISMLENFVMSDIFDRALKSSKVEKERKFLVKISDLKLADEQFSEYDDTGCMVQGIIDMYFEEDDGIVLVDYKTDNVSMVSFLAENYSKQLALYKGALEKMENKKVKQALIYSLKLGKWIEVNV